jgi:hypothetical protein
MPDDFGTVYEGILAYSAQELGHTYEVGIRAEANCRKKCRHKVRCAQFDNPISLTVDPDIVVKVANTNVVLYATHWRTADSFQKKFWRTSEELFQYRVHRRDYLHLNWVFEPLQIKQGLLKAFRQLFDWSEDYEAGWTESHQAFVSNLPQWVAVLSPVSIEKVVRYCRDPGRTLLEKKFLTDVVSRMDNAFSSLQTNQSHAWHLMADNCFLSQQRHWITTEVNFRSRTPIQLGAIILAIGKSLGATLNLETAFESGYLRSIGDQRLLKAIQRLSKLPVRKTGATYRYIGSKAIGRLSLDTDYFPKLTRQQAESFSELALGYLAMLEEDEVWFPYLQSIVNIDDRIVVVSTVISGETLVPDSIRKLIKESARNADRSWLLEFVLSAVDKNLNDLNRDLDPILRTEYGIELKQLAAFGDSGIHVIGDLNSGAWQKIRAIPGTEQAETVSVLWGIIEVTIEAYASGIVGGIPMEIAFEKYVYKRMKTYLSRAPHPLGPAIKKSLEALGGDVTEKAPIGNFINDIARGKTGRYEVDFSVCIGQEQWYLNVITAQDGNEGHKRKEIAGRQRACGVRALRDENMVLASPRCIAVLDGEWSIEYVSNLWESGFELVVSASEWKAAVNHMFPSTST